LLGARKVRWYKGDSQPADVYTFIYEDENASYHLGRDFFVH